MVTGQGDALTMVLGAARVQGLHHALVITGSRGTGKTTVAFAIAAALLCEGSESKEACGTCAACRKVESRIHSDLHVVSVLEDKQDIAVEQVRDLQVTLGRQPVEGSARVVVLDPADRLSEQGQNALLKTLEEPGADTFLLLCTSRPESLLETVRSRTHRLRMLPLAAATVEQVLAEQEIGDPEARRLAARASGGSLGLALDLIEEDVAALHQHLVGFVERPNDISPVACARELLAGAEDRRASGQRLRLVLTYLRALMRESLLASLAHPEVQPYFPDAFPLWNAVFHSLFEAEEDLDLRIGPEQVLTAALFRLQEEWPRLSAVERFPQHSP